MHKEAKISYPCKWEYRIIGDNEQKIQDAVFELIDKEYLLEKKNQSSKGNFVSMHLIVGVESQEERDYFFQSLLKNPSIKMII